MKSFYRYKPLQEPGKMQEQRSRYYQQKKTQELRAKKWIVSVPNSKRGDRGKPYCDRKLAADSDSKVNRTRAAFESENYAANERWNEEKSDGPNHMGRQMIREQ